MRATDPLRHVGAGLGLSLVLLFVGGCNGCSSHRAAREAAPPGVDSATLEGTLRLAEGFALPAYPPEAMENKVFSKLPTAELPQSCTPPELRDRQPVKLTGDGLLAGVMIGVSGFSRQPSRAPASHELFIRDCRLQPSFVVAMTGDTLRVHNDSDYPFMPGFGRAAMARTLLRGQVYEVPLSANGVNAVTCGFTAPCGRTDVVVLHHPLAAISDESGHFRIEHFPTGDHVVISAWHPLFQESKLEVTLAPGERKQIQLMLTPKAADVDVDPKASPAAAHRDPAAPE